MTTEIILAVLGVIIALFAFLRDLFDFRLPTDSIKLPAWVKNRRNWYGIVFLLLFSSALVSFFRNMWLQQSFAEARLELANVDQTRDAQSVEISRLNTETNHLESQIDSLEAAQINQAGIMESDSLTRQALVADLESLVATRESDVLMGPEVCEQIKVTAIPEILTMEIPSPEEEGVYKNVSYQFNAPSDTGLRILLHSAEIILINGESQEILGRGEHVAHFDQRVTRGQTLSLDDGVYLYLGDFNRAIESNSSQFVERKTFHLSTDEGVYCYAIVEVPISIEEQDQ